MEMKLMDFFITSSRIYLNPGYFTVFFLERGELAQNRGNL
jgi:hypothetical protein